MGTQGDRPHRRTPRKDHGRMTAHRRLAVLTAQFGRARRPRESAYSIGIRPATSFTPIPLTRAGPRLSLGRTAISTLFPKAGMKIIWPLRCRGFATMTGPMMATWPTLAGRIGPRIVLRAPEIKARTSPSRRLRYPRLWLTGKLTVASNRFRNQQIEVTVVTEAERGERCIITKASRSPGRGRRNHRRSNRNLPSPNPLARP
jgi:hypothetical protein